MRFNQLFHVLRQNRKTRSSTRGNSSLQRPADFFLATRFSCLTAKRSAVMPKQADDLLWSMLNHLRILHEVSQVKRWFLVSFFVRCMFCRLNRWRFGTQVRDTRHHKIKWLFLNRKGNAEVSYSAGQQISTIIYLPAIWLVLCARFPADRKTIYQRLIFGFEMYHNSEKIFCSVEIVCGEHIS